jgi:hypothetical protein
VRLVFLSFNIAIYRSNYNCSAKLNMYVNVIMQFMQLIAMML